ncbi:MAG: FixH family protein [Saprospiraceae bacterium]|nr:FixH family protein [Saprospiraceae bacterium]
MNWGHKITIVIVLFLTGMLGMVYYASIQNNEMIDDHYYQKELEYQDVIDASQNLVNLSTGNLVSQTMSDVVITLPVGSFEKLEKGNIELLRVDSKIKDVQLPLKANGWNVRTISKSTLIKGMYKARIRWTSEGKEYYKEESVFVEKEA